MGMGTLARGKIGNAKTAQKIILNKNPGENGSFFRIVHLPQDHVIKKLLSWKDLRQKKVVFIGVSLLAKISCQKESI